MKARAPDAAMSLTSATLRWCQSWRLAPSQHQPSIEPPRSAFDPGNRKCGWWDTSGLVVSYDGKLLARLPADAQDGPVARLCRQSTEAASAAASLLEAWVDRFDAPAKCRADITSPNASAFWSALWELTTAAALSSIGFAIDLRARLDSGRTPDLIVERDGLRTMVEVFVVQNDAETAYEQQTLNVAARALQDRLDLPAGTFLSLTCLRQVTQQPSEDALDTLAHAITSWLQEASPAPVFEHREEDLPVDGTAMFGDCQDTDLTTHQQSA